MFFFTWLRRRMTIDRTKLSAARHRSARFRPGIEALEDRCLLSAGFLDPTFAGGGMTTTNYSAPNSLDQAYDVAAYPAGSPSADGKVVVVGTSVTRVVQKGNQASTDGWDYDFALARYNPDGTLDSTFGQGGKVTTAIGQGTARDVAVSVELVGNKILAAGYSVGGGFALARYNSDGSLDMTFGNQGKVLTKVGNGGAGLAMKVDLAGKIVMAGTDGRSGLDLVRYTTNGALDRTFGKGGIVTTSLVVADEFSAQMELAITPASAGAADAGKIVVVGRQSGSNSLFVARYTTAGALDSSFDNDGVLVIPTVASAPSVAIQADGHIVVSYSDGNLQLVRLNSDGSYDTSFDGDGKVTLDRPDNQRATSVAVQPDGKIVVAGDEFSASTGLGGNFFVARFTSTGELDASFGSGGVALSTDNNLPSAGNPIIQIALQSNGKMVVCGWTDIPGVHLYDFAVARFEGDGA